MKCHFNKYKAWIDGDNAFYIVCPRCPSLTHSFSLSFFLSFFCFAFRSIGSEMTTMSAVYNENIFQCRLILRREKNSLKLFHFQSNFDGSDSDERNSIVLCVLCNLVHLVYGEYFFGVTFYEKKKTTWKPLLAIIILC